jgi:cyclic beta-1,2-glucan synthetase
METYGKTFATRHQVINHRASNRLLKRLADNEAVLLEVHELMTEAVKANRQIIPAAEWLLDNFYLIQEQIHTGKKHLPKGYSEDLPRLVNGPSAGLPRVYDIAVEIVSHSDGRMDAVSLINFIDAYQTVTKLKLGELWAIPIMLRLALIENLRRLSTQIAIDRINRNIADYWAEKMMETAEKDPTSLILVIADMARSGPPMVSSFVAELTRCLQGKGPALALPLTWIEQRLSGTGQSSLDLVHSEIQKQAADQVSMSNSINSLRFLGTMDWREFVESTSEVEKILREDLGGTYPNMDFSTRDRYRHIVEKIAKESPLEEDAIATLAIQQAKDKALHVGYYLIGKGITQTKRLAKTHFSFWEWVRRKMYSSPLLFYVGSIVLLSLLFGGGLFAKAYGEGLEDWVMIVAGILSVLCTSQLAISLVNWLSTLLIQPRLLPRMDFSEGIPDAYRTLVVVPTMLTGIPDIEALGEALEVRYLANRDGRLHYGLLTDFLDAPSETMPQDDDLLEAAQNKIKELNTKYQNVRKDIFFLFHRPRKWNDRDRTWMGYERKRGKLTELNALLREGITSPFSSIIGEREVLKDIKYVVTLDTDTQLPRDSAWKMVATMAHPLNQGVYDARKRRVTEGYGILQPRVAMSLPGPDGSLYAHINGNDEGIDPYTRATSDIYQDLFGEGSFIGKGIYDVDLFSKALDNCFPENRILSHDLLEGCYARCGLLSDVALYEAYPSGYTADVNRRHRWIRGDWQIGAWMLPLVPGPAGRLQSNPLTGLSRWKIFDNLRRSLLPSGLLLLLLCGWTLLHTAWFWTFSVIAMVLLPHLVATASNVLRKPKEILLRQHIRDSIQAAGNLFLQTVFTIACIPFEAFYTLHAIGLTNWRMLITHRRLLEWNPSHHTRNNGPRSLPGFYAYMWFSPFTALAIVIYILLYAPINLLSGWPLLIPWMISPGVAWWWSLPKSKTPLRLTREEVVFLRKLGRRTWAFFEQFITSADNWLPPDNYQESPVERIAHRTSPTNIGLSLLANLSARDFGFISVNRLMDRTANTLAAMQKLERYRGHLYNWYDTQTLSPLPPRYISTVDSGNLAGHVLVLQQGLLDLIHQPLASSQLFEGLRATALILADEAKNHPLSPLLRKHLDEACEVYPGTLSAIKSNLETGIKLFDPGAFAASGTSQVPGISQDFTSLPASAISQVPGISPASFWETALMRQYTDALEDINALLPAPLLDPAPPAFIHFPLLEGFYTLFELAALEERMSPLIREYRNQGNTASDNNWLDIWEESARKASLLAKQRINAIERLASDCAAFAQIDYDFLYDKSQHLLTIGYNVEDHHKDNGSYDLLASEARLGVFTGIALGKIPQDSWFALGRQLTNQSGGAVLLSWSGSMFEYLMPLLVMPEYENTLLDQTNKAMVQMQISYGEQRNVPWGISESGYNMVDANLNYQYRAFGVPGLGLKRGLAGDLVTAPYACVMALMVDPPAACKNLLRLTDDGFQGQFGFFEAIDYTPSRLPRGQANALIRSFMVHHQGMSLLSLAYVLLDKPMQRRFESEPQFQATLLLLQERVPKSVAFYSPAENNDTTSIVSDNTEMRIINTPNTPIPEVQLLSNGRYHVMITNSGGGYSRWKDLAVTRWKEDGTCDNWGTFCYIRDMENGEFWSTGHQPSLKQARNYEVVFSQGRAEFRRRDNNIETHTEIVVSPEDDIELRRLRITNRSRKPKTIEVTSYAEVVLATAASDAAHPAFSNLFVETELEESRHAILCTRRPRSPEDQTPWMFHLMNVSGAKTGTVSYETDRMRFVGRRNSVSDPQVMRGQGPLSGSQGSVLDPIISIRYLMVIEPDATATIDLAIGIGETKEICRSLVDKYQDRNLADRAFELSWTHNQVVLRQINATEADAQLYSRLASSVIYANPSLRAEPSILSKNHRGQSGLWSYSISGDLPIVLLQIEDPANIELVKQLVQAHAYWRLKGLAVDLVIWNEDHGGYRALLQNQLLALISAGVESDLSDRPGGIFVRVGEQVSAEDRILFQAVARIIISDAKGTLAYQINRRGIPKPVIPLLTVQPSPAFPVIPITSPKNVAFPRESILFNGIGGFSPDGKEYIIHTHPEQPTPAPWVNVLANPLFGTVISESGQSYTWAGNAHEFRLSPWNNDPVGDSAGEAFYIRDEESGHFWSPAPLPAAGKSAYITRHGFGYSTFEHEEEGIRSTMTVFIDTAAAVKFTVIKLKNQSGLPRRLSLTGYVEWVLGDLKSRSAMHICTEMDPDSGALLATNPYNTEFAGKTCFLAVSDPTRTFTGDRMEFIGRNGTLKNPDAMGRIRLNGKTGSALDPCGAMQVLIDLSGEQEYETVFLLGTGTDAREASQMAYEYKKTDAAREALDRTLAYWRQTLGAIQVETPDTSLNLLANGWLVYQVLACRLWARSGYYQSGGAFGFRDQLQDAMAILHTKPELVRQHILLCASRQYPEGDVQHWWHPPTGRGVRTRCSDDFLWLPFVTCRYILHTGDTQILDEQAAFINGRLLNPGEESYYDLPTVSPQSASLYEHNVRAIRHGLQFGVHGLPLMGSGDWNDGMDRVGKEGKGESIWLGFFLYKVLVQFSDIATSHGDASFAMECGNQAEQLRDNMEKNGWDGAWYRRAYFDDGTPLGSSVNAECQIDSIAQSWSVLSGAGDPQRSEQALMAADQRLVRRDVSLIQLLDPPFDKSNLNPGYIKGYVPGVRENGGQYTHAAIWLVMAFAASGHKKKAWELFGMINPLNHANTREAVELYKVEPYVVAADVYAASPHSGHGGWTWYTGSAGWMYQLVIESLLGLKRDGNRLHLAPLMPDEWSSFKVHYRHGKSLYHILLTKAAAGSEPILTIDGVRQTDNVLLFIDEQATLGAAGEIAVGEAVTHEYQVEMQVFRAPESVLVPIRDSPA